MKKMAAKNFENLLQVWIEAATLDIIPHCNTLFSVPYSSLKVFS